jgi:glutamate-1-semialdehyde 2,1-aminomutase
MGASQELYRKAKTMIPGGTQLLSKRPEQFLPEQWPAYYREARGCEVWDLDGNHFVDMCFMGIGACSLGYADPDVDAAVMRAVAAGTMSTLNAPEEVELAELLLELHPWAEQVRYARCGGEAMAIAVRIARAASRRDVVLFCGYHGWSDWYLAANLADKSALDGQLLPGLEPAGVPRGLGGTAFPFTYNNTEEFRGLVKAHGGSIGAVVVEAVRNVMPNADFLAAIREATRAQGIPLVVDEVSSGFRLNCGGAHLVLGIEPDIAVFAKGMSNGYPMAAVIGRRDVMQAAQGSFISSTYWTERIGPTAAIATIRKMRSLRVQERMVELGTRIQDGWRTAARRAGLDVHVSGIAPLSHFDITHPQPLLLKTLYTQEMLKRGYLASTAYYASWAHGDAHVDGYLRATEEVFSLIAGWVRDGSVERRLDGPVCHSGFRRLT